MSVRTRSSGTRGLATAVAAAMLAGCVGAAAQSYPTRRSR
jgi:hypothetical protein